MEAGDVLMCLQVVCDVFHLAAVVLLPYKLHTSRSAVGETGNFPCWSKVARARLIQLNVGAPTVLGETHPDVLTSLPDHQ